ncbi:MAG: DUF1175 family protein [Bryobacteraceae bacterium]
MKGILAIAGGLAVVLGLGHIVARQDGRRPSGRVAAAAGVAGEDALRLTDPADREAFRAWFTYLAEELFFRDRASLPRDVADCSGLVRYAFRESISKHDGDWAARIGLRWPPPLPPVARYQYPDTPLGANLFRTNVDEYTQFADARTLREWNSYLVSRRVEDARAGDLLFFRQLAQDMPYHVMVFVGESRIEGAAGPYLAYHTGDHPGEVRRPAVADLLAHPEPRWRPVEGNSNFLGVYRWNILRD